jgi:amino acid adenylation domain-containing protein
VDEVLHDLLAQAADSFPDGTAIVDGAWEMTYGQLDAMANRIARQLTALNVGRGDRVGLYLEKSAEALVSLYGVLKAGAAYVPLAPDAPPMRLARILSHARVRVLLTGAEMARHWPALTGSHSPVEYLVCVNGQADGTCEPIDAVLLGVHDLARQSDSRPATVVGTDDVAYVLYTSGSTGTPKGVLLTHRNAMSFINWAVGEFGLSKRDKLSSHAPLHFDLSVFDVFAAAAAAATVVIVPRAVAMFPAELAEFTRAADISVWYSVPSAVNMLAKRCWPEADELPTIRLVLFAGEIFPMDQLRRALAAFPRAEFYNLYGPTETNVATFYHVPRPLQEDCTSIPIGLPIEGVELFCLAEDGSPVGIGERGELWVSGPTVMRGYLDDPKQTAQVLRPPDSMPAGAIAYCTGDLAAQDEYGLWHFFGRRDSQIKSRGYRIELGEIETNLNTHPAVIECAVIPIPDARFGNKLKAYVVTQDRIGAVTLAAYLRKILPRYMVPWSFERVAALPRTSTGKIDYQVLKRGRHGDEHAEDR